MPSRPVPSLASSPNAQTTEVVTAFGVIVEYTHEDWHNHINISGALRDWVEAIQEAVLRVASSSVYGDVNAAAKNAALVQAFDDLIAAMEGNLVVRPAPATLTLTGYPPILPKVTPGTRTLTITGYAPTVV